jgi:hypothetical protein
MKALFSRFLSALAVVLGALTVACSPAEEASSPEGEETPASHSLGAGSYQPAASCTPATWTFPAFGDIDSGSSRALRFTAPANTAPLAHEATWTVISDSYNDAPLTVTFSGTRYGTLTATLPPGENFSAVKDWSCPSSPVASPENAVTVQFSHTSPTWQWVTVHGFLWPYTAGNLAQPSYQGFWVKPASTVPPLAPLSLWLRADAGVTSSASLVSSWGDQSGNGLNAGMAAAGRQPSLINNAINGKPVIRFSGAQSLALSRLLSPSRFTFFVAGKNTNTSSSFSMIFGPGSSSANNQLRWENGTQALLVGTGNGMPTITATVGNTRVYHVLSASYDGSTLNVYRDGKFVAARAFTLTQPWDLYQIGAWYSDHFMKGDVAEILFYSSALSESDRGRVDTYLRTKYALP